MRVLVLGPIRVVVDGREVAPRRRQQRLVLALLVAAHGRAVTTDRLLEGVWGDELPKSARKTLQAHISGLRAVLGARGAIETDGDGYRLSDSVEIDAVEFESRVADGVELVADDPRLAAQILSEGLGLWRGEPFADVRDEESLLPEIDRLLEVRAGAIEHRIEADIALGGAVTVIAELEALVQEHPRRERLRSLHMTALYLAGRQTAALASYRRFRADLIETTGLEPSRILQDLEVRILQQDPGLGPMNDVPEVELFTQLPARYSSFHGRGDALDSVIGLVGSHRLVTLVGPGGIGKSSLAAEALRRIDAPDVRVLRVDVEVLGDTSLRTHVANAMGLRDSGGEEIEVIVSRSVAKRPTVLFLDGCEGRLDEVGGLVARLLEVAPNLTVLATSRERLGLPGELVERVGPLATEDGVALFCDRSRLDQTSLDGPSREHIEAIVGALDGMPLAIELAAVRHDSTTLDRLADLLLDQVGLLRSARRSDRRDASLEAALRWSHDLLDVSEQRAFEVLAVFRSGFGVDAAHGLLGDDGEALLHRLVDVSLVQPPDETARYRMLEPIRQFGRFLLERAGSYHRIRTAHARWVAERCREISELEWSSEWQSARSWLLHSRDEIAAAVEWSVEAGEPEIGAEILALVGRRIANQGHGGLLVPAAFGVFDHDAIEPTAELAVAMANVTHMLDLAGDDERASILIERAEAVAAELNDPIAIGTALGRKAARFFNSGPRPEHLDMMLRAVSMLEHVEGAPVETSAAVHYLNTSLIAGELGEAGVAEDFARRGRAWERELHGTEIGQTAIAMSRVQLLKGDLDSAVKYAQIAAAGHSGMPLQIRDRSVNLAWLLVLAELPDEATEAVDRSLLMGRTLDIDPVDLTVPLMRLALVRQDVDTALAHARQWFEWALAHRRVVNRRSPTVEKALRGSPSQVPDFPPLLLTLTEALLAREDTDSGCRFVANASRLMADTAFASWAAIGEPQRWDRLARRCPDRTLSTPAISLEGALHQAAEVLGVSQ